MRTISRAGLAIIIAATLPATALAQANHNTARSNKNTVAAPAGESDRPDSETGDTTGTVKANINTSRSNSKGIAPPAPDGSSDAGPANINTSRSNTKAKNAPQ